MMIKCSKMPKASKPLPVIPFTSKSPGDDFSALNGANPASIRAQGNALYKKSQYRDALQAYETALSLNPRSKTLILEKAKCLVALGETDKALAETDQISGIKKKMTQGEVDSSHDTTYKVRYIFQKAEALFSKGDFEQALVYFHKGHKMRPQAQEFRLGIIKSEEALQTVFKKSDAERERKKSLETEARKRENEVNDDDDDFLNIETPDEFKNRRPSTPPIPEPQHVGRAQFPMNSKEVRQRIKDTRLEYALIQRIQARKLRAAMEGKPRDHLQDDKDFLKSLRHTLGKNSTKNKDVTRMAKDGMKYIDTRYRFWKQNLPYHLREKSTSISGDAEQIADQSPDSSAMFRFLYKETLRITEMIGKGQHHRAIDNSKKLIRHIEQMKQDVPGKGNVLANCCSIIGNAYLELNEDQQALAYHMKDLQIGNQLDMTESKSRALDNLGRVYARIGDFRKAIVVWSEKVKNYPNQSPHERAWIYHELGHCYLEMDDVENARACAEKSLQAANEMADNHWQLNANVLLAQAFLQSGEAYLSRDTFMKALEYAAIADDGEKALTRINTALTELNAVIAEWKEKESSALSRQPSRAQSRAVSSKYRLQDSPVPGHQTTSVTADVEKRLETSDGLTNHDEIVSLTESQTSNDNGANFCLTRGDTDNPDTSIGEQKEREITEPENDSQTDEVVADASQDINTQSNGSTHDVIVVKPTRTLSNVSRRRPSREGSNASLVSKASSHSKGGIKSRQNSKPELKVTKAQSRVSTGNATPTGNTQSRRNSEIRQKEIVGAYGTSPVRP